MAFIDMI